MNINWHNIRALSGSQQEGFEEFVCQLARNEEIGGSRFIRKGSPDGGVECFWIFDDGSEIAWQAKFFTSSFADSQWRQIDSSVATALEKHQNLKKYIVALPIDPPDGRVEGTQSLLAKWDERCATWREQAAQKGMNVTFEAWWSSDLLSRLSKPENDGLMYFWFGKQEFSNSWFEEQNNFQIKDLGPRYIVNLKEKLNVELNISQNSIGLLRGEKLKEKIDLELKKFFKALNAIGREFNNKTTDALASKFNDIKKLLGSVNAQEIDKIPIETVNNIVEEIKVLLDKLDYELHEPVEKEEEPRGRFGYKSYYLNVLKDGFYDFRSFINSSLMKLANSPYLLVTGDAGMGKSHLLADIIRRRQEQGAFSLFLLGQKFVTDEEPWVQIKRQLDLTCSKAEFFGALNSKAQVSKKRLIIFIDALNEGRGKNFWQDSLRSFVSEIQKYPWLGLVLSVRTTYEKVIIPDDLIVSDAFLKIKHSGFIDNSFKASELFFKSFGIASPTVPLLHPEFTNPLFLLLFCQGLSRAGHSSVPKGLNGMAKIFSFFIDSTNRLLASPKRFNYSESQNLVNKSIEILVRKKIEKQSKFVGYEEFLLELNSALQLYGVVAAQFLEALISEGVLTKNIFWDETSNDGLEGIYLAYERFEEHMTAKYLIESTDDDIGAAFEENGIFYEYFKSLWNCQINKGLLEALSIQIPEKTGNELFTYLPLVNNSSPVVESYVQSLLWREINTIDEAALNYINSVILLEKETKDLFFDALISVGSLPLHAFNADFLHKNLMSKTLPQRDAFWTTYLFRANNYYDENSTSRLINWAWDYSDDYDFDKHSIELAATVLAWFLTSTSNLLRNKATKSLVALLKNNIEVLVSLLKKFENVDDPYVYERLLAVAYGAAVLTNDYDNLKKLAEYVYSTIFGVDGEIYPHFLLRDYARGVVEFAYLKHKDMNVDIEKIRPPYRSSFPSNFPTNDEIDKKYKVDYKENTDRRLQSKNFILSSMTTEYGRGVSRYGDFGRYTFQSALREWDVNPDKLSNLAVDLIFEKYGFNAELHGDFDLNLGTGRTRDNDTERIGKKYQWLALHEILARVVDNCSMKESYDWGEKNDPSDFGPWKNYRRDIDLTFINNKPLLTFDEVEYKYEEYEHWNADDWIKSKQDLPKLDDLIFFADADGQEWLVLEAHLGWEELSRQFNVNYQLSGKSIWYQIRSYLVKRSEIQEFESWSEQQDFTGRWMPEPYENFTVFDREFYWSPAYFAYVDDIQEVPIRDRQRSEPYKGKVILTTDYYRWENLVDDFDGEIHYLRPSLFIYNKLNLKRTANPFEYVDQEEKLSVFSSSSRNNSDEALFVNKQKLENFLVKNDLAIFWTVLGEKQDFDAVESDARLMEVYGVYMLKDGSIKGNIKTNTL